MRTVLNTLDKPLTTTKTTSSNIKHQHIEMSPDKFWSVDWYKMLCFSKVKPWDSRKWP